MTFRAATVVRGEWGDGPPVVRRAAMRAPVWQCARRGDYEAIEALAGDSLARELVLWQVLVWRPEAAAVAAGFRPDDRLAGSAWARQRAELEARGAVGSQYPHHGAPRRFCLDYLVTAPHTGPPAGAEAAIAPSSRTGGAVRICP